MGGNDISRARFLRAVGSKNRRGTVGGGEEQRARIAMGNNLEQLLFIISVIKNRRGNPGRGFTHSCVSLMNSNTRYVKYN